MTNIKKENIELLNEIHSISNDFEQIVKLAIKLANDEKKDNRTSNYNMTIDIKDNMHNQLKEFTKLQDIDYHRCNLSQYFIINGTKIKIKFHNNLSKIKKEIIEKATIRQMMLPLEFFIKNTEKKDCEWEIGIEISKDRKTLKAIRMVDFNNKIIETLYQNKSNILDFSNNNEQQERKSNFKLKESIIKEQDTKKVEKKEKKNKNDI